MATVTAVADAGLTSSIGFVLVFCSNHTSKTRRFEPGNGTDGQTDISFA